MDACTKCGKPVLALRETATRDALRGAAPLCPVRDCPLVARVSGFATPPVAANGTELFGASPPAVFVGRFGYPRVAVGPLLPPTPVDDPALAADTTALAGLDIATILQVRSRLVRSKSLMRVDRPVDEAHALAASRELAQAARPVETEVTLAKPLALDFGPRIDALSMPMGPSVDVVKTRITENAPVPRKVDALVGDVHAPAATAATELFDGGIGTEHIQRLLSVGLLGEERRRRLVPTRWAITATDDIVGKTLIERIRGAPDVSDITYHYAALLGNHFHVVLMPRPWSFEMVEAWVEAGSWGVGADREGSTGRTDYAANVTGAYYAARLAVLEHLVAARRQASVLVYREITEDYWAPLGVWVIREAVRAALATRPLAFGELPAVAQHVARRARFTAWADHVQSLKNTQRQRRLTDFDA